MMIEFHFSDLIITPIYLNDQVLLLLRMHLYSLKVVTEHWNRQRERETPFA